MLDSNRLLIPLVTNMGVVEATKLMYPDSVCQLNYSHDRDGGQRDGLTITRCDSRREST